ncbi:hypothetical protein V9T40_005936 [Parthenolecanium corni]|uniref:Uncharacterized protein n=1 Tax=Parthenolecanium corni TaxID=536013 RepID=A0AAN9TXF9_9HEMI
MVNDGMQHPDLMQILPFFGYSGREVLVITADDKVYGVGMNSSGCLGLGDTNFHERPGEILSLSNKRVKGFACGGSVFLPSSRIFVLAYLHSGEIYQWGSVPHESSFILRPQQIGIDLEIKVKTVACGRSHCMILSEDGKVFTWGDNGRGQLGHSENQTLDDYSHAYGTNQPNRVKGIIEEKTVIDISCGGLFSVVLLDNGKVVTWGNNVCGELGFGGEGDYETSSYSSTVLPTEVSLLNDAIIGKIACGRSHVLALSKTGILYVWGDNYQCQLGQPTNHRRCGNPAELKTHLRFIDIGACFASDISVAQSEDKKVYMWGNVSPGKIISEPTDSNCSSVNHVFSLLTYPSIMIKPMKLRAQEPKPSAVLNSSINEFKNVLNEGI